MLNNGHKKRTCGFADEVVAYIYDEIGQQERLKFESHLAGCDACADEFAGLSNARFSIFEWKREEFAHLATPEINIPYPTKQSNAAAVGHVGFLAGIRELLTLSGWSSAIAVAGALVVCFGLGFVAINYFGGSQQIAHDVTNQSVPPVDTQNTQIATVSPDIATPTDTKANVTTNMANKTLAIREIRPVRVSVRTQRFGIGKNLMASNRTPDNNTSNVRITQQKRKAPALTEYADEGDKSLRLADLFDEIGSKR